MVDGKYLSEDGVIDLDDIYPGYLNLIQSDCGSGKTKFVFDRLLPMEKDLTRCIYLIDTTVGRDQKIKEFLEARKWEPNFEKVINNEITIFDEVEKRKIFVMTYAKFGSLCKANPYFSSYFDLIIADEFHNCIKYIDYDKGKICKKDKEIGAGIHSKDKSVQRNAYDKMNALLSLTSAHYTALYHILFAAMQLEYVEGKGMYWTDRERRVLAITATPERVYKEYSWLINEVETSCQTIQYETFITREYASILNVLNKIEKGQRGIIFAQQINLLQLFCKLCQAKGFKAISLWSTNNEKYPLTEEQKRVRNYIIERAEIPPEYDILLINKAYETAINITGKVDYMVIHDSNPDVITQVRGRYRGDLSCQYLHTLDKNKEREIKVPLDFLDRPLNTEEKRELCKFLDIPLGDGTNICGWTTIKKKLLENGYKIKEVRKQKRRCSIISL